MEKLIIISIFVLAPSILITVYYFRKKMPFIWTEGQYIQKMAHFLGFVG